MRLSVVTPTLRRPQQVRDLLACLAKTTLAPDELVLVDGAPPEDRETEAVVSELQAQMPFAIQYVRSPKGTAVQRNRGIDLARGSFIAFIDDDVRVRANFFEVILAEFEGDQADKIGAIVGIKTNLVFDLKSRARWRWYRRLRLLKTTEPGRYDFATGYPINAAMQGPFAGVRPVDFMTTACAVWRAEVFQNGLRFHSFFKNFGVLEDAHLSLRAGRDWRLLQAGQAHCHELNAAGGRGNAHLLGFKSVINYYFVFRDIAGPLSFGQRFRFWRFQAFEMLRLFLSGVRRLRLDDFRNLLGRCQGAWHIATGFSSADPVEPKGPKP